MVRVFFEFTRRRFVFIRRNKAYRTATFIRYTKPGTERYGSERGTVDCANLETGISLWFGWRYRLGHLERARLAQGQQNGCASSTFTIYVTDPQNSKNNSTLAVTLDRS